MNKLMRLIKLSEKVFVSTDKDAGRQRLTSAWAACQGGPCASM
jgi:hypothetical protein